MLCLKTAIFLSGFVLKKLDNEWNGRRGVITSPLSFLSSIAQRSLTCASSHITVMRLRVIFKENLNIQNILIHQKSLNSVVNSFFLHKQQVLRCGTIWRHHNDDFIRSDLIGQKFLNDWNVGTMNDTGDITYFYNEKWSNWYKTPHFKTDIVSLWNFKPWP